jgi:succinate-semialdehyde dehydrogenase/glutarate-semialdehyde dehydrogenase
MRFDRYPLAGAAHDRLGGTWYVDGVIARPERTATYRPPALPEQDLTMADVSSAEALKAASLAGSAQDAWRATPPMARAELVRRLQSALERRKEELVELVVLESAKPFSAAQGEVDNCLRIISTFLASVAESHGSARTDFGTGRRVVTSLVPVGPALLISPWNFPLNLGMRKLVTSLLAGCVAVWKPSDRTSLTAMAVAECLIEAGFPAGVVSIIPTTDSVSVVSALMQEGTLRKLSFTGSTSTGKALMAQASDQLMRTSLELGGNGPAVVAPSANVERAAQAIVAAKFTANGQVCTAINRLYVHRSVADELVRALSERLDKAVVGEPIDPSTTVGPLISTAAVARLNALVDGVRARGARISTHGTPVPDADRFLAPTLLVGVDPDDAILQEELFGPVLPVVLFDELDDAIRMATATPYGLSSYAFADETTELEQILAGMRSGLVAVNSAAASSVSTPFGGTGWSGHGRENGVRGLAEFQDEITYVY